MSTPQPHEHGRDDAPDDGSGIVLPQEEARQGESSGRMRYVLFASLGGISLIFLVLWLVIARL